MTGTAAQPLIYLTTAQCSDNLKHHILTVNKFDVGFEVKEPFVWRNDLSQKSESSRFYMILYDFIT